MATMMKKVFPAESPPKPKLMRVNATRNANYVPDGCSSFNSSFSSSFSDADDDFRLVGIDGEVEHLKDALGIPNCLDLGIPMEAWLARKKKPSHLSDLRVGSLDVPKPLRFDAVRRNSLDNSALTKSPSPKGDSGYDGHDTLKEEVVVKQAGVLSSPINGISNGPEDGLIANEPIYVIEKADVFSRSPCKISTMDDMKISTMDDMLVQTINGPKDISVVAEHIQSNTSVMANLESLSIADKGAETDNTMLLDETKEPTGVSLDTTGDTESGSPKDVEVEKVDPFSEKGNWRIQRMLGSGSFGVVYEIVTSDGAFFAAKEVSLIDQGPSSRQAIVQLEQEIVFLTQYQHENIVKYWGTERRDDKFYIFLELMTQGSLASLYKKGPLFERQLRKYTRQILQGLKYLHDHQIFHRDIKCANILVDASGVVKLADFGMAKQLSLANEVQSCKGSAYWMAPEVINPRKAAGLPADIWSLGCTVLEMFARSPPFGELEWHVAFWKIGSGEVPPLDPDLPDDAKDFLAQCLQPDPSKRPTAAMLLEHPFVNLSRTSSQPLPKPVPNDLATIEEETSNDLAGSSSVSSSGSGSSYTKTKSVRTRRSQS